MLNLVIFVPVSHLEVVKKSLFDAGAGKLGNYDSCCFVSFGKGQFRPLAGSKAFVGQIDQVEVVEEARIELVCDELSIVRVISALKSAHPYETPAYCVTQMLDY